MIVNLESKRSTILHVENKAANLYRPSDFVKSEEGSKIQKQLWKELSEKLEKIQPGIMANI